MVPNEGCCDLQCQKAASVELSMGRTIDVLMKDPRVSSFNCLFTLEKGYFDYSVYFHLEGELHVLH